MMKNIILILLTVSQLSYSEEIIVSGVREKIKSAMEISCSEGKPIPENEREPSPAIPKGSYSKAESQKIVELLNAQPEKTKECTSSYTDNYVEAMYQYCEKYNLAACIGGGCAHTSGYSVHTAVLVEALSACGVQL